MPRPDRFRPAAVELEDRSTPAVAVRFDFAPDAAGFFDAPARRAALERAAGAVTARLEAAPGGAGEVVVPVGAAPLGAGHLAEARDGAVTFDTDTAWAFGPAAVGPDQYDLTAAAEHELLHVLGFNAADPGFARHVAGGAFVGPAVVALAGGPVPLAADGDGSPDHWAPGTTSGGEQSVMAAKLAPGARPGVTELDRAALADSGWKVAGLPTTPAPEPAGPAPAGGVHRLDAAAAPAPDVPRAAVGGAGEVTLFSAYGQPVRTVAPFPGYSGPVRAAVGDATGDGVPDLFAGTGAGVDAEVRLFDGASGALLNSWRPFEAGYAGGVYVAAADLNQDGRADAVVTPDDGGGPVVAVYDGAKLAAGAAGDQSQATRFYGLDDPAFRGGVRAAAGDLDGDGRAELVVAAGVGGGPRVSVLDGSAAWGGVRRQVVGDFFAFAPNLRGGANVAVADLTGAGHADLVLGAGAGGGPRVTALDGRVLTRDGTDAARARPIADYMAGDPESRAGVAVAAADAQVLTTPGTGGPVQVTRVTPAAVTVVTTTAAPAVPPPAPAPAADPGAAVLAFAEAHVGQVATDPTAAGCAALAAAALRSAGADPDPAAAGPNPLHYSWGRPVYQRDTSGAYARLGDLADVRPGDVLQMDNYLEVRPDGSWSSDAHHTAVVESVDAAAGRIAVLEQNAGGDPAVTRGDLRPADQTTGVVTAYRPVTR